MSKSKIKILITHEYEKIYTLERAFTSSVLFTFGTATMKVA